MIHTGGISPNGLRLKKVGDFDAQTYFENHISNVK